MQEKATYRDGTKLNSAKYFITRLKSFLITATTTKLDHHYDVITQSVSKHKQAKSLASPPSNITETFQRQVAATLHRKKTSHTIAWNDSQMKPTHRD